MGRMRNCIVLYCIVLYFHETTMPVFWNTSASTSRMVLIKKNVNTKHSEATENVAWIRSWKAEKEENRESIT